MKHYTKIEWQLFIDEQLDPQLQEEMQEHLQVCDDCMDLYSGLIDESSGTEVLPETFTDQLMELIRKEKTETTQKRLKQRRINLFICYASAASITLFLMSSGVFQGLYQGFASSEKYLSGSSKGQSLFTSGWTDKLTNETSRFINSMKSRR